MRVGLCRHVRVPGTSMTFSCWSRPVYKPFPHPFSTIGSNSSLQPWSTRENLAPNQVQQEHSASCCCPTGEQFYACTYAPCRTPQFDLAHFVLVERGKAPPPRSKDLAQHMPTAHSLPHVRTLLQKEFLPRLPAHDRALSVGSVCPNGGLAVVEFHRVLDLWLICDLYAPLWAVGMVRRRKVYPSPDNLPSPSLPKDKLKDLVSTRPSTKEDYATSRICVKTKRF